MPIEPIQLKIYCPCCGNEIIVSTVTGFVAQFPAVKGGYSDGHFNPTITCKKCDNYFTYNVKKKTITFHFDRKNNLY